jgi:glycerol-3-phosphate dehydrogenase subunit B
MDSHHFDVIVVGAGLSGLTAAGAAARDGLKVALVATGPGSFVLGSGCVEEQEFARPGAASEMADAIAFFREMAQAAGCPYQGGVSEAHLLPTILGGYKSVALAPRFLWNADPGSSCATAIVGVKELSSFDESFMAERLNEQARRLGFNAMYQARKISLAPMFKGPVTTVRIAARFDSDHGFRAELLGALRIAASGFERVLVPGMLGLNSSEKELGQFEHELGCSLSELPTLPPSISGLRLFHRLRGYLREIGVELFEGHPVVKVQISDGLCTELVIASPGHPLILRGDSVVLAAGQHTSELFGNAHSGHDDQMRTFTAAGKAIVSNLFDAGTGSRDGTEKTGNAAQIFAGHRAGIAAAATRGKYAAR